MWREWGRSFDLKDATPMWRRWLDVALVVQPGVVGAPDTASVYRTGRTGAMRYFFHYELPKIGAWLGSVETRDMTCANFPEEAF